MRVRIEAVSQCIAQQVEAEHGGGDGKGGEQAKPFMLR